MKPLWESFGFGFSRPVNWPGTLKFPIWGYLLPIRFPSPKEGLGRGFLPEPKREAWSLRGEKLDILFYLKSPIGIFYYGNSLRNIELNRIFYQLFGLEGSLKGFDLHNIPDKKAVEIMESVLKERNSKEPYGGHITFYFRIRGYGQSLDVQASF